jgi:hypothetical protein
MDVLMGSIHRLTLQNNQLATKLRAAGINPEE